MTALILCIIASCICPSSLLPASGVASPSTTAQSPEIAQAIAAAESAVQAWQASSAAAPSIDVKSATDELVRQEWRRQVRPVGHVWAPFGIEFEQRGEGDITTPTIPLPAFAVEEESNRPKGSFHRDVWYTVVPQEVCVSQMSETPVFDNPFQMVTDPIQKGAARDEGRLFRKDQPAVWNHPDVVRLTPATEGDDPTAQYYERLEGYEHAPKEVKRLTPEGEGFETVGNYFKRSDGKIVKHNKLDIAFATYPNFFKRLALLGAETAAHSLMYSFFKEARLAHVMKVLMHHSTDIVGGGITLKSLEKRIRFMPFNPFHLRALPYLGAYMALTESFRFAERHTNDFSHTKATLKSVWRAIASPNLTDNKLAPQYLTGIPISAYPVIEFLTTGRIGALEKLGELASISSIAYVGVNRPIARESLDMVRRFMIVYFTLQGIDKDCTQKLMRVLKKDRAPLLGHLQAFMKNKSPENQKALRDYVESNSALSKHSLLSRVLGQGKGKKISQRLTDAQVLFKYRFKSTGYVNMLWSLPLLVRGLYTLAPRGISFAKSLVGIK